ncbi:hypothetical protein [Streptomyces sp. NBRC 14336]|uniref:hypothetical protein n=1 Tax=Streptomyces sp. NBRC 14336 TaxID=3030992 RepID=UPI002552C38E|nr:hypothetical protein [Streptomyces sp. NBRC 14336]WBO78290.1 hypothetical protein SBE_001883 [Streptomyces sp. SBE_14.2]
MSTTAAPARAAAPAPGASRDEQYGRRGPGRSRAAVTAPASGVPQHQQYGQDGGQA